MPLVLLPNVFSDEQSIAGLLPVGLSDVIFSLDGLIAENERSGRRYLLKIHPGSQKMRELPILLLNEHTDKRSLEEIEAKIHKGEKWGLISDSGLPAIADPGSHLVLRLRKGLSCPSITAIPGPSSLFLALMISGLPGQRFSFQGYLPKEEEKRKKALSQIEKESHHNDTTQIWIETPYRNQAMFESVIATLKSTTLFSVASSLTFPDEEVHTKTIHEWKKKREEGFRIVEKPTVFLLYA